MKKLGIFLLTAALVLEICSSITTAGERDITGLQKETRRADELVITDIQAAWVDIASGAESEIVVVMSTSNPKIKGTSAIWHGQEWYGRLRLAEVLRLREFVIGKSPYDVEKTTAQLHSRVNCFYADDPIEDYEALRENGIGPAKQVSAIDLAIKSYRKAVSVLESAQWDIIGKAEGKPVYELFGGPGGKVRAYISSGTIGTPIEQRVKEILDYSKQNYTAIKLRYRDVPNPERALKLGKAIRDAVGDKMDILVDGQQDGGYSLEEALEMIKVFEQLNVRFLEEPLARRNRKGLATLTASTDIPTAGSEVGHSLRTFQTYLEDGLYDIAQPDLDICGGFTEARKIMLMARSKGKKSIPHLWLGGLGMATTLQMIGSIEQHEELCPYIEYPLSQRRTVEVRDMIIKNPLRIDKDGYIHIPNKPGLGVELKDEILQLIEQGKTEIHIDKNGKIIKTRP